MKNDPSSKSLAWLGGLASVAALLAIGYFFFQPLINPTLSHEELELLNRATVEEAKAALHQQDWETAGALALQILDQDPSNVSAMLVAGEAATKLGNVEAALKYYQAVPSSAGDQYLVSLWSVAYIYVYQGRLREAERHFREVLDRDPKNLNANLGLAFVLGIIGKRWESVPYLLEPIKQGSISMEPLMLLATIDTRPAYSPDLLKLAREVEPDNFEPLVGLAYQHFYAREADEAERLVRQVLEHHPDDVEAHVLLGRIYLELRKVGAEQFNRWLDRLPAKADEHPTIWYLRGAWAHDHGDLEGAARCLWEAARRNPNHQEANYRLSRILRRFGRDEDSQRFADRAKLLERLLTEMYPLYSDREKYPDPKRMMRVADLCSELGRYWEAWAWYHLVKKIDPENPVVNAEGQRLTVKTSSNPPLVDPELIPANKIDLSGMRMPLRVSAVAEAKEDSDTQTPCRARLVNVARDARFDFVYNNGDDLADPGLLLPQELGGAMAVLDYDLDGWPDLYAAQGGPWPVDPEQTEYRDQLFRNLGDGTFQDVTQQANLGDNLYSQGATVGDFDNDGWPDIFVSNLGANRIYRNQGDGTFADVTDQAGIEGKRWSTSAAFADLNGDGLPDLYVVNYLAGRKPLITTCYSEGKPRACSPHEFPGDNDMLYLNQGNGHFLDVSEQSGVSSVDGRGLGVVVGDFHGQGKLSVYVANDMSANTYFVSESPERGGSLRLVDRALVAGLAYGGNGELQASMGIAAGDGDGDGLIDFFCTHFYNQSNTYYRQISPDFFEDATLGLGLRDPGFSMLSFGTQFIDFENDGFLDLMLACGHIEDFRHLGEPFMMKPQAYSNRQGERFQLLEPEAVGEYFAGEYLGRSVALIDWDRDGLQDLAVLHLYSPSSFLANRSEQPGHFVQLHLRSVRGERDAIGTTVTAQVGQRTLVRQLMAGNGFQCSNQRVVHFGIDQANQIDQLHVKWPSGTEQTFENVEADRELFLVEGASELVEVPRD